jgi:hypothetical protein
MNGEEKRHRDPGPRHGRRRCLRNRLYLHDDTINAPPTLKSLRVGKRAAGLGYSRGDVDKEVPTTMSIAPRKPVLKVVANLDYVLPFWGLQEQLRQCLQGGNDTTVPPLSDPVS